MQPELFAPASVESHRQPLYECRFSPESKPLYRYSLIDRWDKALPRIVFVGLNPSTADEYRLDPTLTRIKRWSADWGFGSFVMLNLFAFRSPDPKAMQLAADPIGPRNDETIDIECKAPRVERIVACWGAGGSFMGRAGVMLTRLHQIAPQIWCFGRIADGSPIHPLARGRHRIPDNAQLQPYV